MDTTSTRSSCICWELGATAPGQTHTRCRAHDQEIEREAEFRLMLRIARRAVQMWAGHGLRLPEAQAFAALVIWHHLKGGLRLSELVDARDPDFAHDIGGMLRDERCFSPRYSVQP